MYKKKKKRIQQQGELLLMVKLVWCNKYTIAKVSLLFNYCFYYIIESNKNQKYGWKWQN